MKTEYVSINNKNYILHLQYQDDEKLRLEFNRLTQKVWKFDFENYYQSGFWDDSCILYSLFDDDAIASHITVNLFKSNIDGEFKNFIQLGTVMTDEAYQKKGLSRFLMEKILHDFKGKHDGIFLFANETVLDFYPKFGFTPTKEFEAFQVIENLDLSIQYKKRKLELDEENDLKLFEELVEHTISNTIFPTKNKSITFFYCYASPEMGYKNSIYFIEELHCAVVIETQDKALHIVEIFSPEEINLNHVIAAFDDIPFDEVVLGFSPKHKGFQYRLWKDDVQLFVTPELLLVFEKYQVIVPLLSHT
ncbi:GNAT family N-acetyltransferase [Chryseobacterium tructae]|uniref:GNAT family N-acetyltransferase n=1 Tax=Chryseobacterium tructae TaxID=1037380 RepID=A0ABV7XY21_9FLAO|nr:GNAT family N-acetyltransferase [Chryseobacterium tructae]MDN3693639.1 GNAT family N-acetyltransferase [Chryseobacterium tructae]